MKKIINVKWDPEHLFPKKFEDEYGKYIINGQDEKSLQIDQFNLQNLEFLKNPFSKRLICGSEFNLWIKDNHFVPVDIFQAKTIFENKGLLKALIAKWREEWWETQKPNYLSTINFFGNTVMKADRSGEVHIPCFQFTGQCCGVNEEMVAYENTEWMGQNDFALVFKKEFIKQLGI
ncbi:MAG: hypothetical protein ACOYMB_04410 [Patescibacteria group bacterium]